MSEQAASYSHCPKCGQQVVGGQFLCGHRLSEKDAFYAGFDKQSFKIDPIGPTLELRKQIQALTERAEKAERERDELVESLLNERDEAIEAADELAYTIFTVEQIGEHSSCNNPWEQAKILLLDTKAQLATQAARIAELDKELARVWGLVLDKTVASIDAALNPPEEQTDAKP